MFCLAVYKDDQGMSWESLSQRYPEQKRIKQLKLKLRLATELPKKKNKC
jgi:hypothetical protein